MSRTIIAGAVLGAGLIFGGTLIQSGAFGEANAASADARLLDQVIARVRAEYIDTLDTDELQRRAAVGFVRELEDAHSSLLTEDAYRRLQEATTGRYAGIGIEIDLRDGFVTVIAPLAGTPADSAGIEPGDRIVAIDGKSTVGLSMEDVQIALRGAPGTTVKLSVERDVLPAQVVTLRRTRITYHPVQRATLLSGGVGYVELASFSETAARELRAAVDSLRRGGASSLVLDLRENPGGLLEQGIEVADLFLDRGQVIASTRGRTPDADQEFTDQEAQPWPTLPVVVLMDSGSASASEIVAGALKDHERAALVGTRSYGKGSAQSIFPVTGGRALKLTTARWFTPDGLSIEGDSLEAGIEPHVVVREWPTKDVPIGARPAASTPAVDPVLARALQLLQGVTTTGELLARVRKLQ
jgi:carboxyl-terminal processing protease